MERLFVRILNTSLIVLGFLTLAGSILVLAFLAFAAMPILSADTKSRDVHVLYESLNQLSGSITSHTNNDQTASFSQASALVSRVCAARAQLAKALSNGQLDLDLSKCGGSLSDAGPGSRQANHLSEEASYLEAATKDPQLTSKYAPTSDQSAVASEIEEIESAFEHKFNDAAQTDDERKGNEQTKVMLAKTSSLALLATAVSLFMTFLIIAFLIVAIRIEKHLSAISDTMAHRA